MYKISKAPAVEPITLAEAKSYIRVTGNTDDNYITNLIVVVREFAENFLSKALIEQEVQCYKYDLKNTLIKLELKIEPVIKIVKVQYKNLHQDKDFTLMDAKNYNLQDNYLSCQLNTTVDVLLITYQAGYGNTSDTIPQSLKEAMLAHIAFLYDNRGNNVHMPQNIINMYKAYRKINLI